jgi:hypothetical protein
MRYCKVEDVLAGRPLWTIGRMTQWLILGEELLTLSGRLLWRSNVDADSVIVHPTLMGLKK